MSETPQTLSIRSLAAVADAARFFTRLPVPERLGAGAPESAMSGTAAASPLAGALVGAGSAAILLVCLTLGLPPTPAAVFAAAAAVALSGALHLDGLADFADGVGGGRTREAKLAIMRDSRLGTFGGAALALSLAARISLVAALAQSSGAAGACLAIVVAAAVARPLAFLPTLTLPPARDDGLGRSARPAVQAVAFGLGLAALIALVLVRPAPALAALALAGAAAACVSIVARRHLGGYTGDVCGAAAELAEIAALAGLAAFATTQ